MLDAISSGETSPQKILEAAQKMEVKAGNENGNISELLFEQYMYRLFGGIVQEITRVGKKLDSLGIDKFIQFKSDSDLDMISGRKTPVQIKSSYIGVWYFR